MAKYIAHASIDERGKIAGGNAGDSTKKEVCIRTWYNKPWNILLRIKDAEIRNQFANNMIDLANNNNVGYDQNQRNTLLTQAKKVDFDFSKIAVKCECDCSSAVTVCILGAIYKVKGKEAYEKAYGVLFGGSNCATTSTLRSRLKKLEMITVYSDKSYVGSTTKALFGDIYVKEGSHVVAYIDDGKKAETNKGGKTVKIELNVLKKGSEGEQVKTLQRLLIAMGYDCGKAGVDGDFGSSTDAAVRKYQKDKKLEVDGSVGQATWTSLLK